MLTKKFLCVTVIALFCSCGVTNVKFPVDIRGIRLSWQIPIVSITDGSLTLLNDSFLIYYKENMILLRAPYKYVNYKKATIVNDTISLLDEDIENKMTKFLNFIYVRDMKSGLGYDSIDGKGFKKFKVDSLLKIKAFRGAAFLAADDSLVKSTYNKKALLLSETYVSKKNVDESFPDTSYLTYTSRIRDIEYSFSKEADSIKKMKLFKVEFIYNPIPKSKMYHFNIPRRHFIFKIEELDLRSRKEIDAFFERFKKDFQVVQFE